MRTALVGVLVVVAACGKFSSADAPTPTAATPSDAGASAVPDADLRTMPAEVDASLDADVDAGPTCAGFCDDFSSGTLSTAWTPNTAKGGKVGLGNGAIVASMGPAASINPTDLAEAYESSKSIAFPASKAVRVEADVRIDKTGERGATLVAVRLENGDDLVELFLFDRAGYTPATTFSFMQSTTGASGFGAQTDYYALSTALPEATWLHLAIDLDFTSSAPTVTASLALSNGDTTLLADHAVMAADFLPAMIGLDIGVEDVKLPLTAAWNVTVDNVAILPK